MLDYIQQNRATVIEFNLIIYIYKLLESNS